MTFLSYIPARLARRSWLLRNPVRCFWGKVRISEVSHPFGRSVRLGARRWEGAAAKEGCGELS
jgi:hypothetical protein